MTSMIIASNHDCTIRSINADSNGKPIESAEFRVHRATVGASSVFFQTMMISRAFNDTGKDIIKLREVSTPVLQLILSIIHGAEDTIPEHRDLTLTHVWELAAKIDEYGLMVTAFKSWYRMWYKANIELEESEATRLLYPTWDFDYAKAFQRLTKGIVYESAGHIAEGRPRNLNVTIADVHMHLPERVIGSLNAARGRLKTMLQKILHSQMRTILEDGACPDQEGHLFKYLQTLTKLSCWPVDDALAGRLRSNDDAMSISDILEKLKTFLPYGRTLAMVAPYARRIGRLL